MSSCLFLLYGPLRPYQTDSFYIFEFVLKSYEKLFPNFCYGTNAYDFQRKYKIDFLSW